ncbi:helix-turn-helix domain-containing protein [Nonomuraea sp. NPDC050556]|uniref:helix-turn-helix domain-containing protein n=1 Tax=Nonomuraea sp. NPDC050556 TaxID=3364369 RepID=UPI0037AD982D
MSNDTRPAASPGPGSSPGEVLLWVRRLAPVQRRRIRDDAGLSRATLGRWLGCTDGAVVAWEIGRRTPAGMLGERYGALLQRLLSEEGR